MKYSEYQVWFHAFNSAFAAITRNRNDAVQIIEYVKESEIVANYVLDKFKTVESPESNVNLEGFDLQGLVDKVSKDIISKKKR